VRRAPAAESEASGAESAELVPGSDRRLGLPAELGAAAARFAELSIRKSDQTKATYLSSYRRFAVWLADYSGERNPRPQALTADAVAAYVNLLEQTKAPATVKKERSAINRLARYLHTLGAIDATEILMIEGSRADARPRSREALSRERWEQVRAQDLITVAVGWIV